MGRAFLPYILPLFFSASMLLAVAIRAWHYRKERTNRNFFYFLCSLEIWTVGFAFEILSPTLESKIFWANIQFLGLTTLPIFWLETVMSYTGLGKRMWKQLPLIPIFLLATNLVIWTNPLHHMFRGHPQLETTSSPFLILVNDYGPWFYAYAAVGYLPFLFSFLLMGRAYHSGQRVYRRQIILLFVSVSVPLGMDMLYTFDLSPIPNFNLTTMFFGLSATVIGAGLFRLRLFDLLPIVQDIVIENMADGVLVLDLQDRIVNINPAAREIIQAQVDSSMVGVSIRDATARTPELLKRLQGLNEGRGEIVLEGDPQKYFDINISLVKNPPAKVIGRVVIFHEMTEQVHLFEEVKRLAMLDPLTEVYNRRHFFQTLVQEIMRVNRYGHSLGLIMLDLDHFKRVNDTYGHIVGDGVLKTVAKICRENVRVIDLVARYGGEEFVVLLPQTPLSQTRETAERLRRMIGDQPLHVHEFAITLTASVGGTSLPPGEEVSPEDLIESVDQNLYAAKAQGRNCVVVVPFHPPQNLE